jgi:hypothetical protein
MTTKVEKTLLVDVPVRVAYNQWTQFEEFPEFMGAVKQVEQLDDKRLRWVAQIAGVKREWEATILEQVPDQKVAWAATEGATNAGAVYFAPAGDTQTTVTLSLEYEPEGIVEKIGDKMDVIEKNAEQDLERFKTFIEARGYESGGWRGTLNEGGAGESPGVEAAAETRGDSGKTGIGGKAVLAGAGVAAAGLAAASALKGKSDDEGDEVVVEETVTEIQPVTTASPTVVDAPPIIDEPVVDEVVGIDVVDADDNVLDTGIVEGGTVEGGTVEGGSTSR